MSPAKIILPDKSLLLYAELTGVAGFSGEEALRIVCWEHNIGEREYDDPRLKKRADALDKNQDVKEWRMQLRKRDRSMRRLSAELAGRYTIPVCRGEASAWLRRNYDPEAKGPRQYHQQKLLDFVSKGVPEERDLESSALGTMLGTLANRVLQQQEMTPPPTDEEDGELTFQ